MTLLQPNTILAATDLSGMGFLAVRKAAAIARARNATLEILHVIDSFSTAWADAHLASGPSTRAPDIPAEDALTAILSVIHAEFGIRANGVVAEGKPAVEIAARSEAVDADLTILGSLGATAHRVLARSRRPVLLVKHAPPHHESRHHGSYSRMLVAADSEPEAAAAASCARSLFPEAAVTLHAYEDAAAARRVCAYARESETDLIVVGSPRVPLLRRLVIGSVSVDTIAEAECDVLLVG